ncbi:hypothetical protein ACQFN5_06590 [Klebsiella sp. WOUb02]|uniref:hypothetical protein n=1 Tax=Klebsiella sp. WOUb02 TaxID=3161071 RepID=UPI003CFAAF79
MKLSDAEKLTLAMVCEIHTSLKLNNTGYNSKLISDALESGNTWAIDWKYSDVLGFEEVVDPPDLTQVVDVMDMVGVPGGRF